MKYLFFLLSVFSTVAVVETYTRYQHSESPTQYELLNQQSQQPKTPKQKNTHLVDCQNPYETPQRCRGCVIYLLEDSIKNTKGLIKRRKVRKKIKPKIEEERKYIEENCKDGKPIPPIDTFSVDTFSIDTFLPPSISSLRKEGGADSSCHRNTVILETENDYWVFYRISQYGASGDCKTKPDSKKEITRVKAPPEELQSEKKHENILEFITVLINYDDTKQYRQNYRRGKECFNDYFCWRNNNLNIDVPFNLCETFEDCYSCPSNIHPGELFKQSCTHYASLKKKYEAQKRMKTRFSFIVPAKNSNKIWLISQEDGLSELKQVKHEWFEKSFANETLSYQEIENEQTFRFALYRAMYFVVQDNSLSIKPFFTQKDVSFKLVGKSDIGHFIVGVKADASGVDVYDPISLKKDYSDEVNSKLISKLSRVSDVRPDNLVGDWIEGGERVAIDFIPTSWKDRKTPTACLDNAKSEKELFEKINQSIDSESKFDLILDNGLIWRHGEEKPTKAQDISQVFPNHSGTMLQHISRIGVPISKKGFNKVGYEAQTGKILFTFKGNKDILWGWQDTDNSFMQQKVLTSSETFKWTDKSTKTYLNKIIDDIGVAEERFWLDKIGNGSPFMLLDYFDYGSERLVLHTDNSLYSINSISINRLSNIAETLPPILFHSMTEASDLKPFYANWKRQILKNYFSDISFSSDIWLNKERLLVGNSDISNCPIMFRLFLSEGNNRFGEVNLCCVLDSIKQDDIIYINGDAPDIKQLYRIWMSSKYSKDNWRANPIGYLDRCGNKEI